ncbi:hypothetical protein DVH24_017050 [Malus domestica]|uniref:Serine-threonine/tyrosine-protein kinase catalytic domain-containing protein n=1 Tax=Malus domestica TaxID=3750 RepID=A0A498IV10_MALDO|nr:hypothetical protein DVH24_017050 [Malus domestica]
MNPKIADFGMARLFTMDQTQGDTKTIVGTYGYMAPEYAIHGRFSVKSDAWRNWKEDTVSNIIDPVLATGLGTKIMRYIHIGLLCVQENVASRPTMASIVSISHSVTLSLPSRPAYYLHNSEKDTTEGTKSYEPKNSADVWINEDSNITEPYPR